MNSVICDMCSKDLSDSGPTPSTRLKLTSEWMPNKSGYRHLVAVIPKIDIGQYDFCSASCLAGFIGAELYA